MNRTLAVIGVGAATASTVLLVAFMMSKTKEPGTKSEGKSLTLSQEQASTFARLALKGVTKECPNKPDHVLNDGADAKGPRTLHPAFYGSFDWHSSVHSHWMVVRLLRTFPELSEKQQIRTVLAGHLSDKNLRVEAEYFNQPNRRSYERT